MAPVEDPGVIHNSAGALFISSWEAPGQSDNFQQVICYILFEFSKNIG